MAHNFVDVLLPLPLPKSYTYAISGKEFDSVTPGFRVLVPNASSHLLDGIEIDYVDRLMGGGFKINNPNASSSCGCGESFA